ncbi:type I polyketide synthase [Streptomyces sp900105245]|uniref:Type I polyketide synthase n=1 Tax=Streptomyces sp. 900105245 TaxID=3154379 RepID=A0ABV1ULE1_9ACTN
MSASTSIDVAIVGIGARAPESRNVDEFWSNIVQGRECITFFEEDQLETNRDLLDNPNFVMAAGIIGDIDQFDAEFFGITRREADLMHPQHRLFLECAWEAFEDAGIDVSQRMRRVSVYGGQSGTSEYLPDDPWRAALVSDLPECERVYLPFSNHLTGRVSHILGLTGESLEVRAACATGLAALALGCRSLITGDADLSLIGAAHLFLPEKAGYLFKKDAFRFSPDGHGRSFDHHSHGLVHTSGVGALLLKRLEDARQDRDHIYAIIKGAALNNDGSARPNYIAPGLELQTECVAEAQVLADVPADTITYVEAHGIAVPMADAIEVEAMRRAFAAQTKKRNFCSLGTVKANIGHSGAAAGVMGLIKTALSLKHGVIPPQVNFEKPHPSLRLDDSPFLIHPEGKAWEQDCSMRRAGVHSFGMGGTNAHVVLEEAERVPRASGEDACRPRIFPLSARTPAALAAMRHRLGKHLRSHPEQCMDDVAYTLALGRKAQPHRWAVVASCREELVEALVGNVGSALPVSGEVSLFGLPTNPITPAFAATESRNRETLENLARAWVNGESVAWSQLYRDEMRYKVSLPTYPFQRQRHWLETLDKSYDANCWM